MENNNIIDRYRDRIFTVYMHICPNNKRYIGNTSQNPNRRWRDGYGYKNNVSFYEDIQKYGWDNIDHKIVFSNLTYNEACNKEKFLIKYYKTNDSKYGYNITKGGDGTKRELFKWKRLQRVCQYDLEGNFIKYYENNKIAARETGYNQYAIAKAAKNHRAYKNYQWVNSNYTKNIKPYAFGTLKEISQIDRDTNVIIKKYSSITEASKELNIDGGGISKCCNLKQYTAGGYIWRFDGQENLKYNRTFGCKRGVVRTDLNGDNPVYYNNLTLAAHENGLKQPCSITDACNGRRKTAAGYCWKYVDETNQDELEDLFA